MHGIPGIFGFNLKDGRRDDVRSFAAIRAGPVKVDEFNFSVPVEQYVGCPQVTKDIPFGMQAGDYVLNLQDRI